MDGFGFLPIVAAIWIIIVVAKKLSQANDERNRQQALEQARIRRQQRHQARRRSGSRPDEAEALVGTPENMHDDLFANAFDRLAEAGDRAAAKKRDELVTDDAGTTGRAAAAGATGIVAGMAAGGTASPSTPYESTSSLTSSPSTSYEYTTTYTPSVGTASGSSSLYTVGDVYTPSSVYSGSYSVYSGSGSSFGASSASSASSASEGGGADGRDGGDAADGTAAQDDDPTRT